MRRLPTVLAALVAVTISLLLPTAYARSDRTATTTVTVKASEWKFRLSTKVVHTGTVVFKVKNAGKLSHDFKINGKKTRLLARGKTARLRVVFKRAGKYRYLCTVPGHAKLGMKGTLTVR